MGWKYEVNAYMHIHEGLFKYVQVYTGEWLIIAAYHMIKSKLGDAGCVKLEWRG